MIVFWHRSNLWMLTKDSLNLLNYNHPFVILWEDGICGNDNGAWILFDRLLCLFIWLGFAQYPRIFYLHDGCQHNIVRKPGKAPRNLRSFAGSENLHLYRPLDSHHALKSTCNVTNICKLIPNFGAYTQRNVIWGTLFLTIVTRIDFRKTSYVTFISASFRKTRLLG